MNIFHEYALVQFKSLDTKKKSWSAKVNILSNPSFISLHQKIQTHAVGCGIFQIKKNHYERLFFFCEWDKNKNVLEIQRFWTWLAALFYQSKKDLE